MQAFFYATIDELTVTNFLRNCRADCSLFQKQNETKRNFVTRRGSGKNWSAGSLIERTVARDARWPTVRAARFPTGFFRVDAHFFFRSTSYAARHAALAHCHANDFCATTKEASDVDVLDLRTRAWEKDSGTSTRLSNPFSAYLGSCLLACSSSLSFSYRRSYPNSSSSLPSRRCLNILVSILVISTNQTPSSFPIALRKTAI